MDEDKVDSVTEEKHDSDDSANDSGSNDSVKVLDTTPKGDEKHAARMSLGNMASPVTPSSSKKRKRLSSEERKEKEKERAEKRAKLEEEKVKREEERQRREQEKKKKEEEKALKAQQREEERLKREEEKRKKQEDDERKRKEREDEKRKKQEEEDRKKREKEEEKRQKEAERKKKLEEEEQRKKEREQDRLKKQEEKAQKELELKKKMEEKENEKKKGEEQLAKQAKLLHSFFKSPSTPKTKKRISLSGSSENDIICLDDPDANQPEKSRDKNAFNPMMFEVKQFMALAPRVRRKLPADEVEALDKLFCESDNDDAMDVDTTDQVVKSWLQCIKSSRRKSGRTEIELTVDNDPEVQVIANPILENPKEQGLVKWRYKLLQFHDNKRPAYWGTTKRKPSGVSPRRPWGKDKEVDYDFDSDDEWEEEPEDAEDLAASDKDDEVEEKEEEEDDEDGWLVPHGYLSDDEGAVDEHLDKDTLKEEEKGFYEELKKQPKIKYPEIQTQRLMDYKIIFCPLRKKWRDHCRAHKSAIPPALPIEPVA